MVPPGREQDFLSPLPIELLRGVGEKTARRLADLGVQTIGQLARVPEKLLVRQFGVLGRSLYLQARGLDHSRVEAAFPPEVVVIEHTFDDGIEEPAELEACLSLMAEKLSRGLKRNGRAARVIALTLIPNSEFRIPNCPAINHQPSSLITHHSSKKPISSQSEIFNSAARLLRRLTQPSTLNHQPSTPIIGIRLKLSDLRVSEGVQLAFSETAERDRRLGLVMESIRVRFGEGSIRPASALRLSGRRAVLGRLAV